MVQLSQIRGQQPSTLLRLRCPSTPSFHKVDCVYTVPDMPPGHSRPGNSLTPTAPGMRRFERIVVYTCSLIFTFLVTVLTYDVWSDWSTWKLRVVKYVLIISYAILIRQLVICPCCLVRAYELQHSLYTNAKSEEGRRAGFIIHYAFSLIWIFLIF